jgi:hypothetical protein
MNEGALYLYNRTNELAAVVRNATIEFKDEQLMRSIEASGIAIPVALQPTYNGRKYIKRVEDPLFLKAFMEIQWTQGLTQLGYHWTNREIEVILDPVMPGWSFSGG